jgi:hypothetical protein
MSLASCLTSSRKAPAPQKRALPRMHKGRRRATGWMRAGLRLAAKVEETTNHRAHAIWIAVADIG